MMDDKSLTPIRMILFCPACGLQHIDAKEDAKEDELIVHLARSIFTAKLDGAGGGRRLQLWNNPPHRSHLCASCGHIWRPADVPTEGVADIQTRGKSDSPMIRVLSGLGEPRK